MKKLINKKGQSAIEYLLMFGVVALVSFFALTPNGFLTRSVEKSLDMAVNGMTNTLRTMCQSPVDGGWSGFSDWSSCSACVQTRSRQCDNPPPDCGGAACTGVSTETQSCSSGNWVALPTSGCTGGACSTTGTMTFNVTCPGGCCNPATRPAATQSCTKAVTLGFWQATSTGACPAPCGGSGNEPITWSCSTSCCDAAARPTSTTRVCNNPYDTAWQATPTSACSVLCQWGDQSVTWGCPVGACCDPADRPTTTRQRCFIPYTGTWQVVIDGPCNPYCGPGTQPIHWVCSNACCDPAIRPTTTTQACNAATCVCLGTIALNSTMCAGDNINLPPFTTWALVPSCTATKCESRCNAPLYALQTGACVPVCQGTIPTNSTMCAGDNTAVPVGTSWTAVAACTATKCERTCNPLYILQGGLCVANVCQGAVPANATACAGDNTSVPVGTSWSAVAACTATKCEATCNAFHTLTAGVCVANSCQGTIPLNATACAGDNTSVPLGTPWSAVAACTATKCEATCNAFHTLTAGVCVANTCQGTIAPNATMCVGDDTSVPLGTSWTLAASCTVTKCQATCNAGYSLQAGVCTPSCQGTIPLNATMCAGDDTSVPFGASWTAVAACTATKCEAACNALFVPQGGLCVANTCQGTIPANATACAGDTTSVPVGTFWTAAAACTATKCQATCNAGFTFSGGVCIPVVPVVNGGWCAWSAWGSCSVSCGGTGTQTQTRSCSCPAPSGGGANCVGPTSQSQSCNNGPCPGTWVLQSWSIVGACGAIPPSCPPTCTIGQSCQACVPNTVFNYLCQ